MKTKLAVTVGYLAAPNTPPKFITSGNGAIPTVTPFYGQDAAEAWIAGVEDLAQNAHLTFGIADYPKVAPKGRKLT